MSSQTQPNRWTLLDIALSCAVLVLFFLSFWPFFKAVFQTWISDTEFSYGMLVPAICLYLILRRRAEFKGLVPDNSRLSLALLLVGCGLQIVSRLNGALLFSGAALAISLMGISGFLWGRSCLRIVAMPLSFLILMVPLPSYVMGSIAWHLQMKASSVSSVILDSLGVPVYRDGVFLKLPNYALEVKQACSGLRSIFALLALAVMIGLLTERKWSARVLLVVVTPLLALGANIVRIVGTGLMVSRFGLVAVTEVLHTVIGISVFLTTVLCLLGFQKILRWANNKYA
jgi:exosortase